MKIKKLLCAALAIVMAVAMIPAAALAADVYDAANEARLLGLLDTVWAELETVEAEAVASGADMNSVTLAVYNAAAQNELVDKASFGSLTDKSFFFTVNGMACGYDFTARNYEAAEKEIPESEFVLTLGTKNSTSSRNVLLVGPYYGHDSSFTDQYRNEADSIAQYTFGSVTVLQSTGATGPAIANACPDAGVVIFDSHGTQYGSSSYLCLTTNSGITSQDYQNGWAVNAGSAAYIDGRYIQNHAPANLPNSFFWMAICEGMKRQGNGTTGTALLAKGAGCVYGYSQSVTFAGDYEYEETFWNLMKTENATVAEALAVMIEVHGIPDPYGNDHAYPIVMSPVDPFPSNPDGPQVVNCDWTLMPTEPIDIEGFSLDKTEIEVYRTFSDSVFFNRTPFEANNYHIEWISEDESIAVVEGNDRGAVITGTGDGQTRVECRVMVDGEVFGSVFVDVNVLYLPYLNDVMNADGNNLSFTDVGEDVPWMVGIIDGDVPVAKSGNAGMNNSTSSVQTVINMQAGETLSFEWKVSSEADYDYLYFYVNGTQYGNKIAGETNWATVTYTAPSSGTYTFKWSFVKDPYVGDGDDCGYVRNVSYSGVSAVPGDMNGDGEITIQDALDLLRVTMDLIECPEGMNPDANGDGTVDMLDALYVLRKAMNLI